MIPPTVCRQGQEAKSPGAPILLKVYFQQKKKILLKILLATVGCLIVTGAFNQRTRGVNDHHAGFTDLRLNHHRKSPMFLLNRDTKLEALSHGVLANVS